MKHRVRFGHHKCLTRYFNRIFTENVHCLGNLSHFFTFLEREPTSRFLSLNNKVVDPDQPLLRNALMFHVIRHPKDLILSGYFYHKRGTEPWTTDKILFGWRANLLFELADALTADELRRPRVSSTIQDA